MPRPTIFVTQETQYDFRPAEEFGDLKFLTTFDVHNNKNSPHNVRLIDDIRHQLRKFQPDFDFILPVGSPYVQAVTFWCLGCLGHRSISILRWSSRDRIYIPLHLQIPTMKSDIED